MNCPGTETPMTDDRSGVTRGEAAMPAGAAGLSAALEEIREREQSATEGPWRAGFAPNGGPLVETEWLTPEGYAGAGMTKRIAYLIGTVGKHERERANAEFIAAARSDVPRLVAALEAALRLHRHQLVYDLAADKEMPGGCPHGPDYAGEAHFEDEDGEWACASLPVGAVCAACIDEGGMREGWPCPTVQVITRELDREAPR